MIYNQIIFDINRVMFLWAKISQKIDRILLWKYGINQYTWRFFLWKSLKIKPQHKLET